MKHITILVPDGQSNLSTVTCIVGALDILTEANAYWKKTINAEPYRVELVGISSSVSCHDRSITIQPHIHISAVSSTSLIIIPASAFRTSASAAKGNQLLIHWIEEQYNKGAEVASMCSGAFMLAATGLLNSHACSTHWAYADTFRSSYPDVELKEDMLITHENGIYTNGGGYSFLNLMLYLVEKYYNRQTAIYISKMFQIEIDRQRQSPFIIFSAQKNHDDDVVKSAQAYIETNLHKKMSVEELSVHFAVGRRHFDRRFIKATGNTPLEYLQRVRIEAAKNLFETTRKNVNEVMYEVGYADVKAFREVFRKNTGMSPLSYRSKYNVVA
jgi:transcriptional regulator GlxA family with amidase domain